MTSQQQQEQQRQFLTDSFECLEISKKISKNLQILHESKEFFDIILIGNDDIQVQAHRIILCASSQHFQETIRSMDLSKKPMEMKVEEFNSNTLESVLQFMYTSSIKLSSDIVKQVLGAAALFKMQPLMDLSLAFMTQELNTSNCLDTNIFAKGHDYLDLSKKSFSFLCNHFEETSSGKDFLELDDEMLDEILSSKELVVSYEEKIVHILLKWLDHNREDRQEDWKNRLSNVRYQFLTRAFIIENSDRLCINLECHKIIRRWLEWHLLPEKRSRKKNLQLEPRKGYQTPKLFLVSGYSLNVLNLQTFYPEFNTWMFKRLASEWDKLYCISTVIDKGVVLITGGYKVDYTRTNEVKFVNIETKEKGSFPSMREPVSGHATAVLNGYLYVIGGKGIVQNQLKHLKSVERYDFSERKWEDVAPLMEPIYSGKAAVLNDCLYVVSSDFVQCYNPNYNSWSPKAPKTKKSDVFGLVSCGGYLYTVGGIINGWQYTDTVERYNPLSDTWDIITSLRSPRSQPMCLVSNNSLIVLGGVFNIEWINTVEEYNIETKEWKTLAPLLSEALAICFL